MILVMDSTNEKKIAKAVSEARSLVERVFLMPRTGFRGHLFF